MKVLLYKIERLSTGQFYLGITTQTAKERWARHQRRSHNVQLRRAIKKYGADEFSFSVVESFSDWESACCAEISAIRSAREVGAKLFNVADGGEGTLGYKWDDERRTKHSLRMIGNKNGLGKKLSKEHSEKLRLAAIAANVGVKKSPEHVAKMRKGFWEAVERRRNARSSSVSR